ncbi:Ca-activated chloride channel family protein [Singulisphaera sp. GP187]|uniref:VWA domain-containing protein n=1 Tax=Singulisphaera sp. GP187 TaxID=1882752 RepID=UPI0009270806|nr:VWA domain-containing protein [Singulisphaera sp. GP187]SIN89183.1 Ca-activated chloride channel family protein [Singulisphaera sp. GP187]
MRLAEPGWLVLLVLAPLPWLLVRSRPRITWPTLGGFPRGGRIATAAMGGIPILLRAMAIVCMVVALARPQTVGGRTRIAGQGVAIMAVLDHSPSMTTEEADEGGSRITRLEAAKRTFARFVDGRPDDLIGLVVFANYPDRVSPLTPDHAFLLESARSIRPALPGDQGTNIGDAIALALEDLHAAPQRRKVLILLTDGQNSPAVPRPLNPEAAARLARELGITLHTIAVGQPGGIVREPEPVTKLDLIAEVDAPDYVLLRRLAKLGGGRAFEAANARELAHVFQTIDVLEKSPVQGEIRTRYREEYRPWVIAALALLAIDRLLSSGRWRRLP